MNEFDNDELLLNGEVKKEIYDGNIRKKLVHLIRERDYVLVLYHGKKD